MCNLFNEASVHSPDWKMIGNRLGVQLEGKVTAPDFFKEWRGHKNKASWVELAEALEKISQYKHAATNVYQKQGTIVWGIHYSFPHNELNPNLYSYYSFRHVSRKPYRRIGSIMTGGHSI